MAEPSYIAAHRDGRLRAKTKAAREVLGSCCLCGRGCGVNRLAGELGKCSIGRRALVSSFGPHFGEEAPLVGRDGSGTVFFAFCNLHCVYCQNYTISQFGDGDAIEPAQLAAMMLALQRHGCHNVNLVSPTHVVPQILEALEIAVAGGLSLPIVYNSGGYDSLVALELLDGIVDIYMPDMKYADAAVGQRLSGVDDYPSVNRAAVKEMHRQVGDLVLDERGIAVQGLLVRHLVLPNGLAGTADTVRFLAHEVSTVAYLNVMAQYRPCHRADDFPELGRPATAEEVGQAVEAAIAAGLTRLDRPRYGFRLRALV